MAGLTSTARRDRVRSCLNWVNGSTLLGLALARSGRARLHRDDRLVWHASGYRGPPRGRAMTVGDVLLHGHDPAYLAGRPELADHERVHSVQWACLGPLFIPLYCLECALSWALTSDPAAANAFEVSAGLRRGGYRTPALRPRWRVSIRRRPPAG